MIGDFLENIRRENPLVHCITNYVTANECANSILAAGGLPIMAEEVEDIMYITKRCNALCINLGMLKKEKLIAMIKAGEIANKHNIPIVLDPAGVAVSEFRLDGAKKLMENVNFAAIRGNVSEIKTLCGKEGKGRGVECSKEDLTESINSVRLLAKDLALKTNSICIASGETDIIADKNMSYTVWGGNPMMSRFTGSGCMLSALVTTFFAACQANVEVALGAVCLMSVCGEMAHERILKGDGAMAFKNKLTDCIFSISKDELERRARYESEYFTSLCNNRQRKK